MPYLALGGHSIGASKVAVKRISVLSFIHFYKFMFEKKYVSVKDSSAEGTCS